MGFRFRKSFKIAPGIKFNLNKNSHSFTFGGKGIHYTVNSDGKRTKSFGIPGSGLYYTETKNGKTKENKGKTMSKASNKSGGGCLSVIALLIMLSIALVVYSFLWIPAIPALIYCVVSKIPAIQDQEYCDMLDCVCNISNYLYMAWISV